LKETIYFKQTKPGPVVEIEQKENKAVFCYNCGRKGHFGSVSSIYHTDQRRVVNFQEY
jgi:hypothetical protein